jgi:hypothetical protein
MAPPLLAERTCSRTSLVLVAAVVSSACAASPSLPVTAPARNAQEAPVVLRFAWPEGFEASVSGAEQRTLSSDGNGDTTRDEVAYRLRLEPAAEGAFIRYEEFALPGPSGGGLIPLRRVPGLERLADLLRPGFAVAEDGRFLGLPGLEATVDAVNRELDALHARRDPLPAEAPALPTRFSAEIFRRRAPVDWWPMVEMWAGREIVPGNRYEVDLVTRMPLLEGTVLRMDAELSVSEFVPCESDGPPHCVELVLESWPDPHELEPLLAASADASRPAAPVAVTRIDLRERVRLLTDPGTLVPRRLETRQRARVTVRLPDGSTHTDALDRESDLVFHPET